jgi:glycosyltransferase involved in cell wall biosynthesis
MINIKILHVISGNDYGGGATYVLNICKAPFDVLDNYLCCIGDGPLFEMARQNRVKAMKLSMKELIKNGLEQLVKSNSIDIINFHGAKANFLYFFIKKNISIPVAVTVHSDYRYDFTNSKLKYFLYTPLSVLGLRSFKNYICVSNHILQLLESKNFVGNKVIIENGIETNDYIPVLKPKELREKYKIKDDDFLFCMVARLHPIKNHISLIKAFKILKSENINIKLMLVGDGVLLEELKNETINGNIQDDVIFTGFQKNSLDYLNACNINVLPSFSEGGSPPLVILESGLVNKPVICSNIGDMNKIIDENIGYLIDPNSVEDIYNKMKLAYLNKNILIGMGNKLNNVVTKYYSIEKFWGKYYSFYNEILLNNTENKS